MWKGLIPVKTCLKTFSKKLLIKANLLKRWGVYSVQFNLEITTLSPLFYVFYFSYKIFEELCTYILFSDLNAGTWWKIDISDTESSEKFNMEHLYFTGFIMLLYITTGHAASMYSVT